MTEGYIKGLSSYRSNEPSCRSSQRRNEDHPILLFFIFSHSGFNFFSFFFCFEIQTSVFVASRWRHFILIFVFFLAFPPFLPDNLTNTLPVVKLISTARCRWPRTLNCGRETSPLTLTLVGPSFHLYRMSLIVYPTENRETPRSFFVHTLRKSASFRDSCAGSEGASTSLTCLSVYFFYITFFFFIKIILVLLSHPMYPYTFLCIS